MSDSAPPTNTTSGVSLPPTHLLKKPKPLKRSKFGDYDVFEVCPDTFQNCIKGKNRYHKWNKYVDDDTKIQVKQFIKENPKKPLLLKNRDTKGMVFVRKP